MIKSLLGRGKKSGSTGLAVKDKPPVAAKSSGEVKSPKKSVKATNKSSKAVQSTAKFTPVLPTDKTLTEKYRDSLGESSLNLLSADSVSTENADLAIELAYKQVFGNAHLMESERLPKAESQVRFGQITVRDFIRQLATSERYKTLFWEKYSTPVFVELNFKHLLGRAPESYQEIAEHMQILAEQGFEAEIDSYLDSEEYSQNFGDFSVPYFRGYSSQVGRNAAGFINSFPLAGVACSSDKSLYTDASSKLQTKLLKKRPVTIPAIRAIPDSYPESFAPAPEPRIPKEFREMAVQILKDFSGRYPIDPLRPYF